MIVKKVSCALIALGLGAIFMMTTSPQSPLTAASADTQNLEGSWVATVTATDPPGLPPLQDLFTFTRDGQVVESRRLYVPFSPLGPLMETTGHGAWVRTAESEFAVKFMFLVQAAPNSPLDGAPLGTDNIQMSLHLNRADELTGTFQSQARDNDGNVVFAASGTVQAKRIRAEP